MLKRSIIFLLLILLFAVTAGDKSSAFFHKKKSAKKDVAEQLIEKDKKVLLLQIYASWCPGCKNIEPTLNLLSKENADVKLVRLDVSTPSKAKSAEKIAEELKAGDFYKANKSKTATVAVIVPSTSEIISVFQNNNDIDDYESAIEKAKAKEEEVRNLPSKGDDKA